MDKLYRVGGRLVAATSNRGGFPKRFITWDQADKPVVLVDPDGTPIGDIDFTHSCYIAEREDRYSLVFNDGSQTSLAKSRCRFPLMRCPVGSRVVACGDGSMLRWEDGSLKILHPSFGAGDAYAPMDLLYLPDQAKYLVSYRQRAPHPIGEVWGATLSRRQRLPLDRLGGLRAAYTFPRVGLGSNRVLLLQVATGTGLGSRLIELGPSNFRQRRVLFESLRGEPDHSRASAFDIDDEGVIWLFVDSYRSKRRLCQFVEGGTAAAPEARWLCSPIEILGAGDEKRSAVRALKVSEGRAWLGTPFGGVAQAVYREAKTMGSSGRRHASEWRVRFWLSVGGRRQGSFERGDWLAQRVLTFNNGKLQIR